MHTKITADFIENDKGEIMLAIPESEGEPSSPKISLSKDGETAVIHRAKNQDLTIGNIHPDIRAKLLSAKKILVSEVGKTGVNQGYYAEVLVK